MASQPTLKRFRQGDEVHEVSYRFDRDELVAEDHPDLSSVDVSPTVATLGFDGVLHRFDVAVADAAAADHDCVRRLLERFCDVQRS